MTHGARSAAIAGAKAANIAEAAVAGFPTVQGFVITTAAIAAGLDDQRVLAEVRRAYDDLIGASPAPLGGPFVLHDRGRWGVVDGRSVHLGSRRRRMGRVRECRAPCHRLRRSGPRRHRRCTTHRRTRPAATLRRDRRGAVRRRSRHRKPRPRRRRSGAGRPDVLVGGTALADHYVLSRRGRIVQKTRQGAMPALDGKLRRSLARMARRAERVFGAPQDIEWCVDTTGRLWMLQSRPVTAVASGDRGQSVVLGPGPIAETFPARLRRLEEDLWIRPLRDGVERALRTAGAASEKALARSPVVTTVNGWAVVDLELFGLADGRTTLRRRINPSVIIRRLGTAWRVGRLRVALPAMAEAIVSSVDRDLAAIPRLDEVATGGLVDLIERARRELATVHSHEVLAGMLLGDDETGPSAAALAAWALHDARAAGWDDNEIVVRAPVVLTLSPPSLDAAPSVPTEMVHPGGDAPSIDDLGSREALRLRARWLQELEARLARELGRRLVDEGGAVRRAAPRGAGTLRARRGRRRWPATE